MTHMLAKPKRGDAQKARRARRATIETAERKAKLAAKCRDGWRCRRCGCDVLNSFIAEAAHLYDKGMGGDHGHRSGKASDYVCLCSSCHRGARSVHSGHLRIEFGPDMGDGPVRFIDQQPGDRHRRA